MGFLLPKKVPWNTVHFAGRELEPSALCLQGTERAAWDFYQDLKAWERARSWYWLGQNKDALFPVLLRLPAKLRKFPGWGASSCWEEGCMWREKQKHLLSCLLFALAWSVPSSLSDRSVDWSITAQTRNITFSREPFLIHIPGSLRLSYSYFVAFSVMILHFFHMVRIFLPLSLSPQKLDLPWVHKALVCFLYAIRISVAHFSESTCWMDGWMRV